MKREKKKTGGTRKNTGQIKKEIGRMKKKKTNQMSFGTIRT
jgi:hypothetical protein